MPRCTVTSSASQGNTHYVERHIFIFSDVKEVKHTFESCKRPWLIWNFFFHEVITVIHHNLTLSLLSVGCPEISLVPSTDAVQTALRTGAVPQYDSER